MQTSKAEQVAARIEVQKSVAAPASPDPLHSATASLLQKCDSIREVLAGIALQLLLHAKAKGPIAEKSMLAKLLPVLEQSPALASKSALPGLSVAQLQQKLTSDPNACFAFPEFDLKRETEKSVDPDEGGDKRNSIFNSILPAELGFVTNH